ncbi:MAG TPA: hypothetical protein DCS37_01415, partial [Clostridiales bacterium]|nr:hypothetical protein [Clostridiales bacterium]
NQTPYVQDYMQTGEVTEQSVAALALSNPKVVGARCFSHNNAYVVALISSPFYLKSERDAFLQTTKIDLSKQTKTDVFVTLDVDVYRKIKDGMTEAQKAELFEKVVSRAY